MVSEKNHGRRRRVYKEQRGAFHDGSCLGTPRVFLQRVRTLLTSKEMS